MQNNSFHKADPVRQVFDDLSMPAIPTKEALMSIFPKKEAAKAVAFNFCLPEGMIGTESAAQNVNLAGKTRKLATDLAHGKEHRAASIWFSGFPCVAHHAGSHCRASE